MNEEFSFDPSVVQKKLEENPFLKLSDIVESIIEEAIVKLHIRPGEKINTAKIADALSVSRAPVREALKSLVEKGIVVVRPNINGYYALDVTDQYMSDLFAARSAIESQAARICASKFRSVDRAHLKECCDAFRRAYKEGNYEAFIAADNEFHRSIINYAGNVFLKDMYKSLERPRQYYSAFSGYYLNLNGFSVFNDFELLVNEHITIYNAISMGFIDVAWDASRHHLDTCLSSFIHHYLANASRNGK